MFGGGQQLGGDVLELVQKWRPSQVYDHENKYQSELQEYLDEELNNGGIGFLDQGGNHVVSTERGISRGDIVVDDTVGVELKRNFSNSQKKKLRGQLEDYADNYSFVIACACGIEDRDGWRELENTFMGRQRGIGLDATQFEFVVKEREKFGSSADQGGQSGILDGFGDEDGGLL